ncbi:hypothetical protein KCP75_19640 [Salmonella enterica subsp. enterica]|nr:hypothetical protein KCP75_19640 [Salmonella enterica subsp. enterica]
MLAGRPRVSAAPSNNRHPDSYGAAGVRPCRQPQTGCGFRRRIKGGTPRWRWNRGEFRDSPALRGVSAYHPVKPSYRFDMQTKAGIGAKTNDVAARGISGSKSTDVVTTPLKCGAE